MTILLEVEEQNQVIRSVEIELGDDATVEAAAMQFAAALGFLEAEEILEDLVASGEQLQRHHKASHYAHCGHRWTHRRVCIDLHFEAEEGKHHFPAQAKWSRVHRWGCGHFHVGADLCANLELREGGPKGPVLNEHLDIGHFKDCKIVWLVKPGPEPYGQR